MSAGEIVLKIFLASLTQVLLWVGGTIIVGCLIALGNKLFYKCTGSASRAVCIASGVIGVPLHELGHAMFCVLFLHKITGMKLFDPSAPDGVLGYVNHSYNPKNFFKRMGNFFIGIGPIVLISGVILLLEWLLVPSLFTLASNIQGELAKDANYGANVFFGVILYLRSFFSPSSLGNWRWWIYIILSCTICLHMNLSKADIKGSLSGLLFTVLIFFLVPIVSSFFDLKGLSVMTTVNNAMVMGGVYYVGVLLIAVVFVYMLVVLAFVISGIVRLIKMISGKKGKRPTKNKEPKVKGKIAAPQQPKPQSQNVPTTPCPSNNADEPLSLPDGGNSQTSVNNKPKSSNHSEK